MGGDTSPQLPMLPGARVLVKYVEEFRPYYAVKRVINEI
jgi:hypothetical protein